MITRLNVRQSGSLYPKSKSYRLLMIPLITRGPYHSVSRLKSVPTLRKMRYVPNSIEPDHKFENLKRLPIRSRIFTGAFKCEQLWHLLIPFTCLGLHNLLARQISLISRQDDMECLNLRYSSIMPIVFISICGCETVL